MTTDSKYLFEDGTPGNKTADKLRELRKQLRRAQREAIELLQVGHSKRSVCEILEIRGSTLNNWLKDPSFSARVDEGRRMQVAEPTLRLPFAVDMAIDYLMMCVQSKEVNKMALEASRIILDAAGMLGHNMRESMEMDPVSIPTPDDIRNLVAQLPKDMFPKNREL